MIIIALISGEKQEGSGENNVLYYCVHSNRFNTRFSVSRTPDGRRPSLV